MFTAGMQYSSMSENKGSDTDGNDDGELDDIHEHYIHVVDDAVDDVNNDDVVNDDDDHHHHHYHHHHDEVG